MKPLIRKELVVPAAEWEATGVVDCVRHRLYLRWSAYKQGNVQALIDYKNADERYWEIRREFNKSHGIPLFSFCECYPIRKKGGESGENEAYRFVWWEGGELTGGRKIAYDMVMAVTELPEPQREQLLKQAHELAKHNGIYIAKRRLIDPTPYGYKCYAITVWSPEEFPKVYEFETKEEAEAFAESIESKL